MTENTESEKSFTVARFIIFLLVWVTMFAAGILGIVKAENLNGLLAFVLVLVFNFWFWDRILMATTYSELSRREKLWFWVVQSFSFIVVLVFSSLLFHSNDGGNKGDCTGPRAPEFTVVDNWDGSIDTYGEGTHRIAIIPFGVDRVFNYRFGEQTYARCEIEGADGSRIAVRVFPNLDSPSFNELERLHRAYPRDNESGGFVDKIKEEACEWVRTGFGEELPTTNGISFRTEMPHPLGAVEEIGNFEVLGPMKVIVLGELPKLPVEITLQHRIELAVRGESVDETMYRGNRCRRP